MKISSGALILLLSGLVGCNTSKSEAKPTRVHLSPVQIFELRTKCQAIVDRDEEERFIGMVGNALTSQADAARSRRSSTYTQSRKTS